MPDHFLVRVDSTRNKNGLDQIRAVAGIPAAVRSAIRSEAAASTAIVLLESVPILEGDYEFVANRPFLFLIRDRVTGTILFIGSVLDPS